MKQSPEFLVALVVLALVVVGVGVYMVGVPSAVAPTKSTDTAPTTQQVETPPSSPYTTYNDPDHVFSFTYPNQFTLSGGSMGYTTDWMVDATTTGLFLVKVVVSKSFEPSTNFSDAKFTVGTSSHSDAVASCLVSTSGLPAEKSTVTINGTTFVRIVTTDAAAGNRYKTTSYRTIHNGQCYAIEYTIHSSAIENYPADGEIKSFDEVRVTGVLEDIVQSFKFTS